MEKLKSLFYFCMLGVLALLLLAFMFRSPVAGWYVERKVSQFNRAYNADLQVGSVRILGLASIRITGITLRPAGGDTLARIDTAYASVGILKLFAGRLSIHDVELKNSRFTLTRKEGGTNYMFLLSRKRTPEDTLHRNSDYAGTAGRLLNLVFDRIPRSLAIREFDISHTGDGHFAGFHMAGLVIRDHYFRSVIEVREDSLLQKWTVAGRIDNGNRMAEFRLYSADREKIRIPFIQRKWQAGMALDTLSFGFSGQESGDETFRLGGFAQVRGLVVDHRMVAARPVSFDKLAVDYTVNLGPDYLEIDSASRVTFNRIDFHPYLRYRPAPTKLITLKISKPSFPAQDFFSSFPEGLYTNLDGIKVQGNLSWYVSLQLDLAQPDSLRFATALNRHQFRVLSYGNADLARINESFTYTAWEHDQPVRTFIVGPENPGFRSLANISRYLQSAVMTSEDGGFYQHRGFLPEAFLESMITNIKERRFARGGSTISMQLVKNVFLSRNKTVARKLEEALIVWLIENQGLCTKDRMFEVYLNIIEWGPMIYGANEAAHFYFNKDASKLTLAEAIFMASIIPRPKWFRYSFDDQGHLRESNAGFYRLVAEKMVNKGWISAAEAEHLIPDVELRGPAKFLLKQPAAVPADSADIQD